MPPARDVKVGMYALSVLKYVFTSAADAAAFGLNSFSNRPTRAS
jgi:hypothetical protein